MEENLVQEMQVQSQEPTFVENSLIEPEITTSEEANQIQDYGQSYSEDPSSELILGKFKNVDELIKAYTELQRFQGENSKELGELRKESSSMNLLRGSLEEAIALSKEMSEIISADKEKYNQAEYFQEPSFRELYKEAITVIGKNLDTDKFVNLLETYVTSRISAYDKSKQAQVETQQVIDSMTYEKNSKTSFTPPKKHFDEMTSQEIDELLEKFI